MINSYAGTSEDTIYIGGLVEKVALGGATHWKHYIAGSTGVVAEYIRHSTGINETVYLLRDHLGSTEMVTNSSGVQMSRLSHDSWGRRRNGGTWNGNPAAAAWTTITNTTRHGFTSHEMLDNLNLVHMNGRVYDQILGRFLSADPLVQAPGFTQSFNRYSYTFNNPLSYTDPSGYSPDGPTKQQPIDPRMGMDNWREMSRQDWTALINLSPGPQPFPSGTGWVLVRFPKPKPDRTINGPVGSDSLSTVSGMQILDTLTAPWGGWDDLKYAVRCTWECDWPGDGSLDANLAALPFIPAVGVEAITARGAAALVGRSFGRFGTIVQNPGIVVRGLQGSKVPGHAIDQIINRGVTPELLRATVANPTVVLQQGRDRFLYLTEQAAVVITKEGQVVTAWTQREFLPGVLEVLSVVGTR